MSRRVVVGFSGGVTSAWCAGWALRNYPREEIVLLFHDTKEEHQDTYWFLHEMAAALGLPITERSDGRSVKQVFRDEGFLGNNQNAMCSRILKMKLGDKYLDDLRSQRAVGLALAGGYETRFPMIEESVTKQQTADWCLAQGVKPSAMYCWSGHANCVGCVKGGRAYWLAVHEHAPEVFEEWAQMEEEFGHSIIRGGDREHVTLRQLVQIGLKRKVNVREAIEIGACDCGD